MPLNTKRAGSRDRAEGGSVVPQADRGNAGRRTEGLEGQHDQTSDTPGEQRSQSIQSTAELTVVSIKPFDRIGPVLRAKGELVILEAAEAGGACRRRRWPLVRARCPEGLFWRLWRAGLNHANVVKPAHPVGPRSACPRQGLTRGSAPSTPATSCADAGGMARRFRGFADRRRTRGGTIPRAKFQWWPSPPVAPMSARIPWGYKGAGEPPCQPATFNVACAGSRT